MTEDTTILGGDSDTGTGYRRPPQSTRFAKGKSGNPKGRPKGRHREIPYDSILGQMVTVREEGRERRITAAEAFILQLTQKGLAGDSAAARASLAAIEAARIEKPGDPNLKIVLVGVTPEGIGKPLDSLGIAVKKNRYVEKSVRWELNPWIVEAALKRLAPRQLTPEEQKEVWNNTRTPQKVAWPTWWTFRG